MTYHYRDSKGSSFSRSVELTSAFSQSSTIENGPYRMEYSSTGDGVGNAEVMTTSQKVMAFLRRRQLLICSLVYVIVDVLINVQYKRVIDHTSNYPLVTVQTIRTIVWLISGLVYLYCKIRMPDYMAKPCDTKPLTLISLLDVFTAALSAVGSTKTTGVLLSMLDQISVPLTMVTSALILANTHTFLQKCGGFMILILVVVKLVSVRLSSQGNDIRFNMLYMLARIPESLAACIKTTQYNSQSFHLVKYQYAISSLRTAFGIPIMTIFMAKKMKIFDMETLSGIWHDIKAGIACIFLGRNTIVEQCGKEGLRACDSCHGALKVLSLYMLLVIIMRITYIMMMMNDVIVLIVILGAIKTPLTSIAFSLPFISGSSSSSLGSIDIICFTGIMCAMILYGLGSGSREDPALPDAAEPMLPEREPSECSLIQRTPNINSIENC